MIPHPELLGAIADEHPRPLVFATISGAHLYGFPSEDSDFDLRGVHLLGIEELFGLRAPRETIEQAGVREGREIDLVTHDARKFFRLMLRRNGYVLEQLLSPLVVRTSPMHERIIELASDCITRQHVRHYLGFAQNQWDLFRKESPPRVKPLLYTYRVLLTGIHLMRSGVVEANLLLLNEQFGLPQIPDLIAAKAGGAERSTLRDADLAFHEAEFNRLMAELESAGQASCLPDAPRAQNALNTLLLELRRDTIKRGRE